jgi:hypothetical protein
MARQRQRSRGSPVAGALGADIRRLIAGEAGMRAKLAARQQTHGDFSETAAVAQRIKAAFGDRIGRLPPSQRDALEQIAVKIARILCGDQNHADHWRDIAGYARLGAPSGDSEV